MQMGGAKPEGKRTTGVYVGNISRLKGKFAVVNPAEHYVRVQFCDVETGYGYGWHIFPKDTFKLCEGTHDDESNVDEPANCPAQGTSPGE